MRSININKLFFFQTSNFHDHSHENICLKIYNEYCLFWFSLFCRFFFFTFNEDVILTSITIYFALHILSFSLSLSVSFISFLFLALSHLLHPFSVTVTCSLCLSVCPPPHICFQYSYMFKPRHNFSIFRLSAFLLNN